MHLVRVLLNLKKEREQISSIFDYFLIINNLEIFFRDQQWMEGITMHIAETLMVLFHRGYTMMTATCLSQVKVQQIRFARISRNI